MKSHIKPEERKIIASIAIDLRKKGYKYHQITADLKKRGFLRRNGTEISVGAIHGIVNKHVQVKDLPTPDLTRIPLNESPDSVDKKLQALGAILKSDIKDKLLIAEWILKAE